MKSDLIVVLFCFFLFFGVFLVRPPPNVFASLIQLMGTSPFWRTAKQQQAPQKGGLGH